jgi:hypothetical protein
MKPLNFLAVVGAMSLAAGAIGVIGTGCSGGSGGHASVIAWEYNPADPGAAIGDVISSITILPPETTDRSLISSDDQLFVHDGEYFLVDKRNRNIVLRFDAEGRFLNTIGSPGRADNEYLDISEACYADDHIEIYSSSNAAIYSYSPDGKFIAKKPFELRARNVVPNPDGGYWAYLGYYNDIMPERLVKTNDAGVVVEKFLPTEKDLIPMPDFINHVTLDGDGVWVREMFAGKIVFINSQGVVSDKYIFDFGKYNPPARYFDISDDVAEAVSVLQGAVEWASLYSFYENRQHSVVEIPIRSMARETPMAIGFRSGKEWRWMNCGTNIAPTIFYLTVRALVGDTLVLLVDNYKIREFAAQNPGLVRNAELLEGMNDDAANPSLLLCKLR